AGMRELERRARAAKPDLAIVLTPHNIHVTGAMAVITSARMAGSLADAPGPVALDCEVDRSSALAVLDALHGEGVPAVGGPYGGHPAAKAFDKLVVDAVRVSDLDRLLDVPDTLLEDAKPDSWWQLLMLNGALGRDWQAELLSYEAPTYYGMLCAAFSPR